MTGGNFVLDGHAAFFKGLVQDTFFAKPTAANNFTVPPTSINAINPNRSTKTQTLYLRWCCVPPCGSAIFEWSLGRVSLSLSAESSNGRNLRSPAAPARSLLSRLLKAPEAGLVLVLAILMLGLTIVGGLDKYRKPKDSVTINLPAGTQARVEQGVTVIATDSEVAHQRLTTLLAQDDEGNLIVERPSGTKKTLRSTGPSISNRTTNGGETSTLVVRPSGTTNTFLNFTNLFLILVFASTIAIMAVGITGVITMGGIDLSVGSIYGLSCALRSDGPPCDAESVLGLGPDDPASTIAIRN